MHSSNLRNEAPGDGRLASTMDDDGAGIVRAPESRPTTGCAKDWREITRDHFKTRQSSI
jgi:hypothetical protein